MSPQKATPTLAELYDEQQGMKGEMSALDARLTKIEAMAPDLKEIVQLLRDIRASTRVFGYFAKVLKALASVLAVLVPLAVFWEYIKKLFTGA